MDPSILIVAGLILNTVGAFLLALTSLGSAEYFAALEEPQPSFRPQRAALGLQVLVNRIMLVLGMAMLGATTLLILGFPATIALLLGPLAYPIWRGAAWVTGGAYHAVRNFVRQKTPSPVGRLSKLLALPILLVTFVIMVVVEYGVSLPLYWISERIVRPTTEAMLRQVHEVEKRERSWFVRARAIIGILLVLAGFIYQLVGTMLMVVSLGIRLSTE